jgi:hypothetical protein
MAEFDPLGTGITIPFRREGGDFAFAFGPAVVQSDLRVMLATQGPIGGSPGELPWRTELGSRLALLKYVGEGPVRFAMARLYAGEILSRDPRIMVNSIEVTQPPGADGRNRLAIAVSYRLTAMIRAGGAVTDDVVRTIVEV